MDKAKMMLLHRKREKIDEVMRHKNLLSCVQGTMREDGVVLEIGFLSENGFMHTTLVGEKFLHSIMRKSKNYSAEVSETLYNYSVFEKKMVKFKCYLKLLRRRKNCLISSFIDNITA